MWIELLTVIVIILAIILLSVIEERDMKEINRAFMNMNLCDPTEVLEYFTLCSTKPTWRVSLIIAFSFALFMTALYLLNLYYWAFFLVAIAISWIATSTYMSYFNFHVWTPAGGQENWNKYRNACNRRVQMKFSNN